MAQLVFPTSPTDGQEYVGGNGVTYTYASNPGVWTAAGGGSSGGGVIPAGTVMSFFQAAAPTGWTKIVSQDNKAVRIVSGAGGGGGGSIGFTTLFSATSTYTGSVTLTSGSVGNTTLTTNQLAAHTHPYSSPSGGSDYGQSNPAVGNPTPATTGSSGNADAHTHSLVGAVAAGNFTSNFAVAYIDMIIASKD